MSQGLLKMYFVMFQDVTYVLCNVTLGERQWRKAFSNGQIVTQNMLNIAPGMQ